MSAKELKVIIKTDAKTGELKVYQGEMAKVVKRVDDFRKNTERSLSAMEKFADRMRNMAHIGAALYAIKQMSDVVVGFGANIVNTAAEFEKLQSILKTLDGSKAKESFEWIKNFTKNTPYELAEVTEAFIKLKAYGLDAKKELKTLGDTAAAMGKPLDQAVEAIADAVNGEFERLKEFGIKASSQGDKVALKWIDASGRMRNAVIENNSKIIDSTIQAIWNEKYAGAMDKLSNTFMGKISNLKDSWASFSDKLAKDSGIFDTAKRFVGKLTEKINELTKSDRAIKEFGAAFQSTAKLIVLSVAIISKAIVGWIELMVTAKAVKDALFKAANTGWEQLKQRFEYFLGWLANDSKKMAYHKKQWEKLQKEWESGIGAMGDELKESISGFDRLLSQFDSLGDLLDDTTKKGKRGVKEIGEAGEKASKHISAISSSFEKVGKAVERNREELAKYTQAYITYLESTGKKTEAFWIKEGEKLRRLYEAGIGGDKLQEVMEADYKKFLESIKTKTNKIVSNISTHTTSIWNETTTSMAQSMQQNFFDYMTGRFRSFKDFLKNILNDILSNLVTPFAKRASSALAGMFGGFVTQAFGAPSIKTTAMQLGLKLVGDVYKGKINGQEVVVSKTGEVIKGQSVLPTDALNAFSAAKTGYSVLSSPAAALYPSTALGAGAGAWGSGGTFLGSIGSGLSMVQTGVADWLFASHGASVASFASGSPLYNLGYYGGGAIIGGIGGYALGKLGDAIFGADTYASTGGATAAAIGAMVGGIPGAIIGAIAGSLLGGLFGKTKVTGTEQGIELLDDATRDNAVGRWYNITHYKKSSWFNSKKWDKTSYKAFTKEAQDVIKSALESFDLLYAKFSGATTKLKIKKGKYKDIETFLNSAVVDAFLAQTGYKNEMLQEVYNIWESYAKKVNKKVYEAFSEAVGGFIAYKRKWNEYSLILQDKTVEALQYKAEYLKKDFEDLANVLGATDVNIENFAQKYEEAIKKNLTPQEINKWKELGDALRAATDAAEALRKAKLQELDSNSKYQEYMLSLNQKLKKEIVESVSNALKNLYRFFDNLRIEAQNFIDSWHSNGYGVEETFQFYAKRYNEVKHNLEQAVISGDTNKIREYFSSFQTLANNLKTATLNTKDPEKISSILQMVETDAKRYLDIFTQLKDEILKVSIVDDKAGLAKNEALSALAGNIGNLSDSLSPLSTTVGNLSDSVSNWSKAITDWIDAINAQFGVKTKLSLEDFYTDRSLMQPGDIKAFANILKPKNLQELDKWINIFGNVRWHGLDYIKELTEKDKKRFIELFSKIAKASDLEKILTVKDVIDTLLGGDTQKLEKGFVYLPAEDGSNRLFIDKGVPNGLAIWFSNYKKSQWLGDPIDEDILNLTIDQFEKYLKEDTVEKFSDYYKNNPIDVDDYFDITKLLPKYAEGGIVTKPTIGVIGEAGYPEAVIPMKDGNIPVRINNQRSEQLLEALLEENRVMREKLTRLERVISRNEGENGLLVESVGA